MPTPLTTASAASGPDAWQELEEVLVRLGQLARSPIDPEAFYEQVLGESVRALSALGGAAWLASSSGALRPVAHVNWPGTKIASNADARLAHEAVLSRAILESRVITSDSGTIVGPVQLTLGNTDADAAPAAIAILEILPRPDVSPAAYRGYEQFLTGVCDVAGEYHAYRELARLRQQENHRDELMRLSMLVHRDIELLPTAYTVANEGRRVMGCDRLTVLASDGRRSRVLATSGASHVERRSLAARRMEELADLVRPTGETAWYSDGQCDALPPIADALEAHADESHARNLAVVPLTRPAQSEVALASGRNAPSRRTQPSFVLIAEQFDVRPHDFTKERLLEVVEVLASALYNALSVDQLPLRWLLRPLSGLKRQVANHISRSAAIAAFLAAAIAALVLVPADFTIEAHGTLEPVIRQDVFAPRSGLVDTVLVAHGADVAAGQPLLKLRDPTLELDLQRVRGEMETVRRQLDAVQATRTSREIRDASPVELYRLSASERELQQQLVNLESQLALLEHERESLLVRSPIAGRIVTWDLASRLTARPVERGEAMLTVADLSADWQLELEVADDRIGHVLSAQKNASVNLPVRFRLRSLDTPHTGHIEAIGLSADIDSTDTTAPRPTIDVVVAFDKSQLSDAAQRELRPGVSARAEIDCGRRSLGYVWLHDLWDTTLTWLRF